MSDATDTIDRPKDTADAHTDMPSLNGLCVVFFGGFFGVLLCFFFFAKEP